MLRPSGGIWSDISSSCCSPPLRYALARSWAAGCGRLAPRRAVAPSSGRQPTGQPDCGRQRRGSARRAGVSSVEAAGPLSPPPFLLARQTSRPTPVERSGDPERGASRSPLHAKNRPRAGHRVISQVGCFRETRSDHPDQEGLWGYRGRGLASRPGIRGWSKPTSRRPAWTPVRARPVAAVPRLW
jgi:hypothetical protein